MKTLIMCDDPQFTSMLVKNYPESYAYRTPYGVIKKLADAPKNGVYEVIIDAGTIMRQPRAVKKKQIQILREILSDQRVDRYALTSIGMNDKHIKYIDSRIYDAHKPRTKKPKAPA